MPKNSPPHTPKKATKKTRETDVFAYREELTQMSITELNELVKAQNIYMPNGTAQEMRRYCTDHM